MSEQDGKIVNLGGLKKFKEYYDTDIITPINNKIDSKTNVQSGEIITTNNDTIGYFKDIKINGNTRYKKSDGTYTDTWESGVSLESMGEKEKNSNGKYPIIIKSSNDTKEDKRTVLLDSPLRKVGEVADVLDLEKMKVTRKIKSITIDGTITNWVQAKIGNNSILWYITLNDAIPNTPSMCDKLKNDDTLWEHDVSGAYRIDETKAFQIRTDKTISNLSALTTWLQANPVTVVYQLATPTTEDIEVSPNTLTDFATSCTLTIDNTIKGNIECNEVVGLIPSVEEDRTRLTNLETDNTTNKSNITNLQNDKAEKNHNHAISNITNLQTTLDSKASSTHNHDSVYVKQDGSTPIIGRVQMPLGSYVHEAVGAGISGNWMLIAEINIKSDNINQPLEFNIAGRNRQTSVTLWILFEATNGTDPGLVSFKCNNTKGYQAYLVKKATSTWSLYINKSEPYDFLDIIDVHIPKYTSTVVTYKSTTVSTLPEGGTYASPVQHAISEITDLQTTLDKKALEKYTSQFEGGAISSNFRKKIIGTTDMCGFVKSFRKNDNTDACMPQYGSGVAWGQADTHGMLCVDYINPIAYVAGGNGNKLNWSRQIAWKDDLITILFERNNGTINKNINTCFNNSSGNFTAPEAGQYLIMCSGYELSSSSSEYVACVLDSSSSNQNKLYTTGSSGFTLITLNKGQALAIYTATAGNMNKTCISSNSTVNMLIARIK